MLTQAQISIIVPSLAILGVFILVLVLIIFLDILKNKKEVTKYKVRESIVAYIFLIPACIMGFVFVMLPIVYSLGYAFTDYYLLTPHLTKWNNFQNFIDIFNEIKNQGDLYHAIKNTALFVVLVVPLQIGLALILALFCNTKKRGVGIFKVCFFAPVVISLSVTSFLWLQILSPSESGLMNSLIILFGGSKQDFLNDKNTVMLWIVLMSAWQGCGYQMLIFISALSNARKDLYEAANLDGANWWNKFIYITLPALKPTLLYIVITVFIGACRVMVQPMLLTGYKTPTMTISYYMYEVGYHNRWVGLSSAVALVMTIFIGTITLLQRKLLGEKK